MPFGSATTSLHRRAAGAGKPKSAPLRTAAEAVAYLGFLGRIPEHLVVLRVDDISWSDWGTQQAIEPTFKLLQQRPPWRTRKLAPAAAWPDQYVSEVSSLPTALLRAATATL